PDDVAPREQLADALMAGGRTAEAAQLMGQIIEQLTRAKRGKDVARYQQRLGAIAESNGDLPAATESYNAAYKLDPGNPATLAALGRLAMHENDIDKA